LQIQKISVSLH